MVWKTSDITLNEENILTFLGYEPAKKAPVNKRVLKVMRQERERALPLLCCRGIYKLSPAILYRSEEIFADADSLAVGLVTVGSELETEVQRLFAKGDNLRAVVLDAIGSVAVEAVADRLNEVIVKEAKQQYSYITRRFSPGYGCWDVGGQKMIFDQLGSAAETLGVKLSGSMLMSPLKSVSFVVKLGQKPMREINEEGCDSCPLKPDCRQRKGGHLCSIARS
ncbi:vitamin B12 dependent-methionine synthase activation domain-containing protein [Dethiobacter alkaliphilus]|uniref:Vitamin B12 dependent methionine synthase activation region n=1 Tax=Dethiobacter alkaliphilus AHT 1 TaxID=555088 RepID=C0GIE7_DETAL|nr:vitamin B12 dependent-methionine synthase activation domain-containing protein [Dethiobacter alkaliphilus]EEG76808.1 Vitamin B12 dependent methionine synthase activation region [Dethiobacter alkaliphilus AHT 1]